MKVRSSLLAATLMSAVVIAPATSAAAAVTCDYKPGVGAAPHIEDKYIVTTVEAKCSSGDALLTVRLYDNAGKQLAIKSGRNKVSILYRCPVETRGSYRYFKSSAFMVPDVNGSVLGQYWNSSTVRLYCA